MPGVTVKWNGTLYPLELLEDDTVGHLREQLLQLTGVPKAQQKLTGNLPLTKAGDEVRLFSLSGLKPGQKLMMIGTSVRSGTSISKNLREAPSRPPPPEVLHAARQLSRQSPMLQERLQNAAKTKVWSTSEMQKGTQWHG